MNPFDWHGPAFLVFYWALIGTSLLVMVWLRRRTDVEGEPTRFSTDPYLLGYLRDGYSEVVRLALMVLVEDGVVLVAGRIFTLAPDPGRPDRRSGRPPIERELIAYLAAHRASVEQIIDAGVGSDACSGYHLELEELGYLRLRSRVELARSASWALAFVLAAVAVIKMLVAFSRGRTNIGLLFISAGLAVVFMVKLRAPPRDAVTARGRQVFDAAEAMLSGAHKRLKDAGTALGSQELAWVAAAFGFSVFNSTAANFAFWPALAFTARPNYGRLTVTGPWGSSGSSCGSAGGSSCGGGGSSCGGGGSSCGGGGCGGGGCGGCGGG